MTEQYLFYSTSKEELSALIRNAVSESFTNLNKDISENKYSDYLTISEASEYLHLSPFTIYAYTSKSEIPFIIQYKSVSENIHRDI